MVFAFFGERMDLVKEMTVMDFGGLECSFGLACLACLFA
jgi:hypothetical protein